MPNRDDPDKPWVEEVAPPFTRHASYCVDHDLKYLEGAIEKYTEDWGLDLDPDFQRAHVWTHEQQVAFVEFFLRGGMTGRDLYTNCPGWNRGTPGDYVLVDGKQRLTATLAWLRNEFPVFGRYYRRDVRLGAMRHSFKWHVNDLGTRAEVLRWYLEFNDGGVVHSREELDRVRALLDMEQRKSAPTLPPPASSLVRRRSR